MKKILLVMLLIGFFEPCFSQAMIGYSREDIKKEFPALAFEEGELNDSVNYIYTDFGFGPFYYAFEDNINECTFCMFFPKEYETINFLVKKYNDKYIPISDSKWKTYDSGGIMYIYLKRLKTDLTYYFLYNNE